MNTLVPLEYYTNTYYYFLFVLVFLTYIQTYKTNLYDQRNLFFLNNLGIFSLVLIIFHMGLRPVSGMYFGDMGRYSRQFLDYAAGQPVTTKGDFMYNYFVKFCSSVMSADFFFLLCSFIYVYGHFIVSKKIFKNYWFYAFLMIVSSFTFWGSGVNGIRNGLATTLFLLALTRNSKTSIFLLMILSVLIHKSLLIPLLAYIITYFYKNTKIYIGIWLLAIPLSLALGGFFENFFLGLGIIDDGKLEGYFTELDEGIQNSKTGFRWDFLVYSASGVFAGWYFIFKKKFDDVFYVKLFTMYLIANTFWVLIIRANFSNRFAYLSWFLLPLIIIYPLLKKEIVSKQNRLIGLIIFGYFIFTFLLNVLLIT